MGDLLAQHRGQALVEFALVLPIFLFLLLGFAELAILQTTTNSWQEGVSVLAQQAAEDIHDDPLAPLGTWHAKWLLDVRDEDDLRKCGDTDPDVSYPDGSVLPGSRVRIVWHCHYQPHVTMLWEGLSVSLIGEAVVPR